MMLLEQIVVHIITNSYHPCFNSLGIQFLLQSFFPLEWYFEIVRVYIVIIIKKKIYNYVNLIYVSFSLFFMYIFLFY